MNCLIPLVFFYVMYLVCTPDRVRFDRYTEWSFYNPDGSDRAVVVLEDKDHPDYHPPDAVRYYREPAPHPFSVRRWVTRLAWAGVLISVVGMVLSNM